MSVGLLCNTKINIFLFILKIEILKRNRLSKFVFVFTLISISSFGKADFCQVA